MILHRLAHPPISHHRHALNRELAAIHAAPSGLKLGPRSVEIGAGRIRRGLETGARWTIDVTARRQPTIRADALRLPFRANALTGLVCLEVLQYVDDPLFALVEFSRVLEIGGLLLLSVPMARPHDAHNDRWRWTLEGLRAVCRAAGFRGNSWALTNTLGVVLDRLRWRWAWPATGGWPGRAGERNVTTGWLAEMRRVG